MFAGEMYCYNVTNDTSCMYYILYESYSHLSEKYTDIDDNKWNAVDDNVTSWGRMVGFFDKNFYINDEIATD